MKKMDTKQIITKKLAAYSAMAGALVLAGQTADAQIVYTDITDESIGLGDSYDLDMDDDGTFDFTFAVNSFTIPSFFYTTAAGTVYYDALIAQAMVLPTNGNSIIGSQTFSTGGVYSFVYPQVLDEGDNIGEGEDFYDKSSQTLGVKLYVKDYPAPGSNFSFSTFGTWVGEDEQFIGVRFETGGDNFYGWVRMGLNDDFEIQVYDYAYQSTADASLEAGEVAAVKSLIPADVINAYSFGSMVNINVMNLNADLATVEIYNTVGQSVYSNSLDQKGMQIDLSNVADGIYTLHINADGSVYNKQLFISK